MKVLDSIDKYKKAAKVINSIGGPKLPITDTLVDILKHILKEKDLDLIFAFKRKSSLTLEQLKQNSKLSEEDILIKIDLLAKKGVIFYHPNRYGTMIYRLSPFMYIFDYSFMRDLEPTEYNKKLANLFNQMYNDIGDFVQNMYDAILPIMQQLPPINRIIPILKNKKDGREINIFINEEIEVPVEKILSTQKVEEIIEKFDDIAVGNCYCRNFNKLLGFPCLINAPLKTCFSFGRAARYSSEQGFASLVSKSEALKILMDAEKLGLVHKTFHINNDIYRDETAICNCCKCCCENARLNLKYPLSQATNYLASIDHNLCKGSALCIENCYNEAILLNDKKKAEINEDYCIGCGTCASLCPEGAISLLEGPRIVRIIPPRRTS